MTPRQIVHRHGSEVLGVLLIAVAGALLYFVSRDGSLTTVEAGSALGIGIAGGFCISKRKTADLLKLVAAALPSFKGGSDA